MTVNLVDRHGEHRKRGGRPRKRPTKEALADMLRQMTRAQIAQKLGVSRHTVTNWAWALGLQEISPHPKQVLPTAEELSELIKTMTYDQIAARYKVSRSMIWACMRRYGLRSETGHAKRKLASSTHHERVQDEFDATQIRWLRVKLTRRTEPARLSYWVQGGAPVVQIERSAAPAAPEGMRRCNVCKRTLEHTLEHFEMRQDGRGLRVICRPCTRFFAGKAA